MVNIIKEQQTATRLDCQDLQKTQNTLERDGSDRVKHTEGEGVSPG